MYNIVIHQPEYLPWINLFLKLSKCQKFVFLDNVQYTRRSFQNRNIISKNGKLYYLTVPLHYSPRETLIKDMKIDYTQDWIEDHVNKMKDCYAHAFFFEDIFNIIYGEYKRKYEYLCDLNKALIKKFSKKMNIKCEFISSSDLNIKGRKSDLILNICEYLNTSNYITGQGSKEYLDEEKFKKKKIQISYLEPNKIKYDQVNNDRFVGNLSIIDYLFNMGFEKFNKLKI